jgi:undecaprenyl-diphosphatase
MQNMEMWQALSMGALQGVAELFPISSLAQTILVPDLFGWNLPDEYLTFVIALHLATAVALVLYFWKDWYRVVMGFLGCFKHGKLVYDKESKFAWLLVSGTVVVGVAGLALNKKIDAFFFAPKHRGIHWVVGVILCVNGLVMLFGDFMKRLSLQHTPEVPLDHPNDLAMHAALVGRPVSAAEAGGSGKYTRSAEDLSFTKAALVGAAQTIALLPGISRSGVTIVAGLFAGLTYEESSRFTFMLATPVIGLAALLKLHELFKHHDILMMALYSSIVAFITAYLSIRFLMKYFHNNRLSPFGYFCIVFGLFSALYLKSHA